MTPRYLAALRDGNGTVWLTEDGRWLPKSAIACAGIKMRRFLHEESARGIAEEFARRANCEAMVEVAR